MVFFNLRRNHAWLCFHNESKATLGRIGRGVFLPSWKSCMIVFPQRKQSDIRPHRSWCFSTFTTLKSSKNAAEPIGDGGGQLRNQWNHMVSQYLTCLIYLKCLTGLTGFTDLIGLTVLNGRTKYHKSHLSQRLHRTHRSQKVPRVLTAFNGENSPRPAAGRMK